MATERWWRRRSMPAALAGGGTDLRLLRAKRGREEVRGETGLGLTFYRTEGEEEGVRKAVGEKLWWWLPSMVLEAFLWKRKGGKAAVRMLH
jgi:hypothetical protein